MFHILRAAEPIPHALSAAAERMKFDEPSYDPSAARAAPSPAPSADVPDPLPFR